MMSPATRGAAFGQQMRRDRQMLYLMIKPDREQAAAMDELRRKYDMARNYAVERIHLTLVPFGDIRSIAPERLALIRRAAASLQAEPFPLTLNRIKGNALVGNRMLALRDFQRTLIASLAASGVDFPGHVFNPHASLSYETWRNRNIEVSPITWRVQQLLLINSIHGKGHALLESWTLEARQRALF